MYIYLFIYFCQQDAVKEPKKRAREADKKDVVKKDDEVPAKRGRGRPPKSGASGGKKSDKPKVIILIFYLRCILHLIYLFILFQNKTGKRGRPKKSDKKEKEESAEEEDSKEEIEDEDDE